MHLVKDQTGAPPESLAGMLNKWEEENAVSLPPGYKDMLTRGAGEMEFMKQELAQTKRALQQVLAQSQRRSRRSQEPSPEQ